MTGVPWQDGLDPEGAIGEVTWLKLVSRKYEGELVTANRPVLVNFKVGKRCAMSCHIWARMRHLLNLELVLGLREHYTCHLYPPMELCHRPPGRLA